MQLNHTAYSEKQNHALNFESICNLLLTRVQHYNYIQHLYNLFSFAVFTTSQKIYIELTRNLRTIEEQNKKNDLCRLHYGSQYQDKRTLAYVQPRGLCQPLKMTALDSDSLPIVATDRVTTSTPQELIFVQKCNS